jgi:hypothetical protein
MMTSIILPGLLALLFALPAHADVFKCKNAQGKIEYSDKPCEYEAKPINVTAPRFGNTPKPASRQMEIEAAHNQQAASASEQMQAALSQAETIANQNKGQGGRILASALCGLWQTYPAPEQRQELVAQAQSWASKYPGNAGLYLSAAMGGRCP